MTRRFEQASAEMDKETLKEEVLKMVAEEDTPEKPVAKKEEDE
jgi:hypothetical protein